MSATRHGLFSAGFMLCDRCVSNAKCERFVPGSRCVLEQEKFDEVVAKLVEEFDLENFADRILVERAAMYYLRIARAEAYDATVGLSEKSAYWGAYISRLDSTLRALFSDLAMNRGKRMQLEKGEEMLVSLDEVIRKFARLEHPSAEHGSYGIKMRRVDGLSARVKLWMMWESDYPTLAKALKRQSKVGKEKKKTA